MNEQCWFIFGKWFNKHVIGFLKYSSEGNPASVSFNWSDAAKKDLIGFHHTHPENCLWFSFRDDKTMKAWVRAEGKPLICGVESNGKTLFGLWKRNKNGEVCKIKIKGKIIWKFFIGAHDENFCT